MRPILYFLGFVAVPLQGRTARYEKGGKSLLLLCPTEKEAFLGHLQKKNVPITETQINTKKLTPVATQLSAFCADGVR